MENASKALLIAAAVLIAILLIALGVRIFNSTSGTAEQVEESMISAEAAQFNSKFTGYIGNKSKANVISLLNQVIANNATNSLHQVEIKSGNGENNKKDPATFLNDVASSTQTTYTITVSYVKGYITTININ